MTINDISPNDFRMIQITIDCPCQNCGSVGFTLAHGHQACGTCRGVPGKHTAMKVGIWDFLDLLDKSRIVRDEQLAASQIPQAESGTP